MRNAFGDDVRAVAIGERERGAGQAIPRSRYGVGEPLLAKKVRQRRAIGVALPRSLELLGQAECN